MRHCTSHALCSSAMCAMVVVVVSAFSILNWSQACRGHRMVQRSDLTDLLIAPIQHQCHYQLLLEVGSLICVCVCVHVYAYACVCSWHFFPYRTS